MRRRESLYIKGNGPPNIIQILGDKKKEIGKNNKLSSGYIIVQMLL
jgi:hypothetical protein